MPMVRHWMAASALVFSIVLSCVQLQNVVRNNNETTNQGRGYIAKVRSTVVAAAVVNLAKRE